MAENMQNVTQVRVRPEWVEELTTDSLRQSELRLYNQSREGDITRDFRLELLSGLVVDVSLGQQNIFSLMEIQRRGAPVVNLALGASSKITNSQMLRESAVRQGLDELVVELDQRVSRLAVPGSIEVWGFPLSGLEPVAEVGRLMPPSTPPVAIPLAALL